MDAHQVEEVDYIPYHSTVYASGAIIFRKMIDGLWRERKRARESERERKGQIGRLTS